MTAPEVIENAGPKLIAADDLEPVSARTPRMRARWIFDTKPDGWDDYAISEWELVSAGFADHHPHDEVTLVIAGELHIESDGVEVIGRAGDTIRVKAGSTGRYWAPQYARMYGVYGPNPNGAETQYLEYWEINE
ncbi:cupin domain-containing protein [bacterium RCC_150]